MNVTQQEFEALMIKKLDDMQAFVQTKAKYKDKEHGFELARHEHIGIYAGFCLAMGWQENLAVMTIIETYVPTKSNNR